MHEHAYNLIIPLVLKAAGKLLAYVASGDLLAVADMVGGATAQQTVSEGQKAL